MYCHGNEMSRRATLSTLEVALGQSGVVGAPLKGQVAIALPHLGYTLATCQLAGTNSSRHVLKVKFCATSK